jgi:hypothetical protein
MRYPVEGIRATIVGSMAARLQIPGMARSTDIADPSQTRRSEYPRLNHLNISASRGHLRSGDVEIVIEIDYS